MTMVLRMIVGFGAWVLLILAISNGAQAKNSEQRVNNIKVPQVLPHRDRAEPINRILKHRLDVLLPELMAESELDMWLVINREYGEDALFYTLVPEPTFAARRTTLLVFVRNEKGVERFSVSRYPIAGFYESRWQGGTDQQQWQRLVEIIEEYNPRKIGINVSEEWAVADGLSQGLYSTLMSHLPEELQKEWLARRIGCTLVRNSNRTRKRDLSADCGNCAWRDCGSFLLKGGYAGCDNR